MARKLGRLVAFVFGPAVLAVIFSASPGVPAYGLAAAHPARGVNSSAADETLAVGSNNSSQAGPGTTIPPFKCPISESPAGACAPCIPLAGNNQPTRFCLPCKPITTEAPLPGIGCPSSSPPAPPNRPPPAPNPTITLCSLLPLPPGQPTFLPGSDAVCGRGFKPGEGLTLTAIGSRGRLSWSSQANARGQFESVLPPVMCRLLPVSLTAIGNSGDRSNALAIARSTCPLE